MLDAMPPPANSLRAEAAQGLECDHQRPPFDGV